MPSKATNRVLIDHDEIRKWVEERRGHPARVKATGNEEEGDPGLLRIDFPGYSGEDTLEPISWDEFFRKFDEKGLAMIVQDRTASGELSYFNKIVSRETALEAEQKTKSSGAGQARRTSSGRSRSASASSSRAAGTSTGRSQGRGTAKRKSTATKSSRKTASSRSTGSTSRRTAGGTAKKSSSRARTTASKSSRGKTKAGGSNVRSITSKATKSRSKATRNRGGGRKAA